MDLGLNEKVALITGAYRGTGAGIARSLAAEGAVVLVHGFEPGQAGPVVVAPEQVEVGTVEVVEDTRLATAEPPGAGEKGSGHLLGQLGERQRRVVVRDVDQPRPRRARDRQRQPSEPQAGADVDAGEQPPRDGRQAWWIAAEEARQEHVVAGHEDEPGIAPPHAAAAVDRGRQRHVPVAAVGDEQQRPRREAEGAAQHPDAEAGARGGRPAEGDEVECGPHRRTRSYTATTSPTTASQS
jgi:NAD(P)-dependent dehydrogenase (short-subunit alcohol dehydrogenase family)